MRLVATEYVTLDGILGANQLEAFTLQRRRDHGGATVSNLHRPLLDGPVVEDARPLG
jgi:hypothetical protein